MPVEDAVYESAVRGRQEFREAMRVARNQRDDCRALLIEAKTHIIKWETGSNDNLLGRIDMCLERTQ